MCMVSYMMITGFVHLHLLYKRLAPTQVHTSAVYAYPEGGQMKFTFRSMLNSQYINCKTTNLQADNKQLPWTKINTVGFTGQNNVFLTSNGAVKNTL